MGNVHSDEDQGGDVTQVGHVVLVGDSTLDNVRWVGAADSVAAVLRRRLGGGWRVTNFAADGFASGHVLRGAVPHISMQDRAAAGDPFPVDDAGVFCPLEQVHSLSDPPTHAVLSIGGNDLMFALSDIRQMPRRVAELRTNYRKIAGELLAATQGKLVVMMCYRPCIETDLMHYRVYARLECIPVPGSSIGKMNGLMEAVYPDILDFARDHRLPVLDLARTFDPRDPELYKNQIEPGRKGSHVIACMLAWILSTHDWGGPSVFYYQPPGCDDGPASVVVEPNNVPKHSFGTWRVEQEGPRADVTAFLSLFDPQQPVSPLGYGER